jgi:hypothetical protein
VQDDGIANSLLAKVDAALKKEFYKKNQKNLNFGVDFAD